MVKLNQDLVCCMKPVMRFYENFCAKICTYTIQKFPFPKTYLIFHFLPVYHHNFHPTFINCSWNFREDWEIMDEEVSAKYRNTSKLLITIQEIKIFPIISNELQGKGISSSVNVYECFYYFLALWWEIIYFSCS